MEYYDLISWDEENTPPSFYSLIHNGRPAKATPGMVLKLYNTGAIRNMPAQVKKWLNITNRNPYTPPKNNKYEEIRNHARGGKK